jgi:hypothetical protein
MLSCAMRAFVVLVTPVFWMPTVASVVQDSTEALVLLLALLALL